MPRLADVNMFGGESADVIVSTARGEELVGHVGLYPQFSLFNHRSAMLHVDPAVALCCVPIAPQVSRAFSSASLISAAHLQHTAYGPHMLHIDPVVPLCSACGQRCFLLAASLPHHGVCFRSAVLCVNIGAPRCVCTYSIHIYVWYLKHTNVCMVSKALNGANKELQRG